MKREQNLRILPVKIEKDTSSSAASEPDTEHLRITCPCGFSFTLPIPRKCIVVGNDFLMNCECGGHIWLYLPEEGKWQGEVDYED